MADASTAIIPLDETVSNSNSSSGKFEAKEQNMFWLMPFDLKEDVINEFRPASMSSAIKSEAVANSVDDNGVTLTTASVNIAFAAEPKKQSLQSLLKEALLELFRSNKMTVNNVGVGADIDRIEIGRDCTALLQVIFGSLLSPSQSGRS